MPIIGEEVIRLDAVNSTNKYAAKGLERGLFGHGTVIVAREQTAGRGQRGREWRTASGLDLAMSVVLLPQQFPAMAQFTVAKAAALAVHDVVAGTLRAAGKNVEEVRIKWPNDVLVGRSKVAGILIENELKGAVVASSVVGIGINVNSTGLDSELAATSLLQETGSSYEMDKLLVDLCARLEQRWQQVQAHDSAIAAAYSTCLWAKGRFSAFTLDGEEHHARPLDVDETGRLIVEDEAGKVEAYGLERLRFRR